ncbi:molybdopterin molybdenumtransferase MoeA, partial [Kitasatospora sp. NPDC059571]
MTAAPAGATARTAVDLPSGAAEAARDCPWPLARQIAREAVAAPLDTHRVDLAAALGRTLSEPLTAVTDLPGFDTSAMDGWAVAGPGPWRPAGRLLAGAAPPPRAPGQAGGVAPPAPPAPPRPRRARRRHR